MAILISIFLLTSSLKLSLVKVSWVLGGKLPGAELKPIAAEASGRMLHLSQR